MVVVKGMRLISLRVVAAAGAFLLLGAAFEINFRWEHLFGTYWTSVWAASLLSIALFAACALISFGKYGSIDWLPGTAAAMGVMLGHFAIRVTITNDLLTVPPHSVTSRLMYILILTSTSITGFVLANWMGRIKREEVDGKK